MASEYIETDLSESLQQEVVSKDGYRTEYLIAPHRYLWYSLVLLTVAIFSSALTYLYVKNDKSNFESNQIEVSDLNTPTPGIQVALTNTPSTTPTGKAVIIVPTLTPVPTVTLTPTPNRIYGYYRNGHGEVISIPGLKVKITRMATGNVEERISAPFFEFNNLAVGQYKLEFAQIPGYTFSLLLYDHRTYSQNGIQSSGYTTMVDVASDYPLGMDVLYYPTNQ